jgi:hypothetical protein
MRIEQKIEKIELKKKRVPADTDGGVKLLSEK